MRHLGRRSAPKFLPSRKFSSSAALACLAGGATFVALSSQANADTVWASKDCSVSPCIVTTGGNPAYPGIPGGRFRVIGQPIQWSALYQATVQRFWVSQGGTNMADVQLTTANGQLGGTSSLPNGLWFISIRTANMGAGTYSVTGPNVLGDPHITAMDGTRYDFQGAGEFTLLKNSAAGFEVQSRMAPVPTVNPLPPDPHTGISSCPSINTAAAIKTPRHRISYQPAELTTDGPQMRLRIDGVRRSIRPQGVTLSDGTRITLDRTTRVLSVGLRKGWGVRVIPQWWGATGRWYLDYDFTPANRAFGIAGALARGSWLPALSDGSSVGAMPTSVSDRYKVLYEKFADSWRVRNATSLFDYEAGTSTATFTNPQWPGQGESCQIPNMRPLIGVDEATATKACAGVIPSFQRACIADVMATGDRVFAAGYIQTQGPARYTDKEPERKGSGAERGLRKR